MMENSASSNTNTSTWSRHAVEGQNNVYEFLSRIVSGQNGTRELMWSIATGKMFEGCKMLASSQVKQAFGFNPCNTARFTNLGTFCPSSCNDGQILPQCAY